MILLSYGTGKKSRYEKNLAVASSGTERLFIILHYNILFFFLLGM